MKNEEWRMNERKYEENLNAGENILHIAFWNLVVKNKPNSKMMYKIWIIKLCDFGWKDANLRTKEMERK